MKLALQTEMLCKGCLDIINLSLRKLIEAGARLKRFIDMKSDTTGVYKDIEEFMPIQLKVKFVLFNDATGTH